MLRLKILYVITKSNWGGAQRYVYDLATNMPQNQFQVAVACGGNELLTEKLREKNIRVINVPAFQRDINFFKEVMAFFQLLKIFRQEKPNIIHLNSSKAGTLGSLSVFIYKLITNNYKLKTIFTVHGWAFKENRNLLNKSLVWLVSWFSSLFQNKIIVINKADLASAKKFIPSGKLSLIHNGIEPIDFLPRERARAFLTEKTGAEIGDDILLIGTIAELSKNKGLSYLLDALAKLARRNLYSDYYRGFASIVIGGGEEREQLERQIQKLGLRDKVFFPGFLPNASQYLKAFDIFILPSLKEGLPYTIMEAMSAELPIIASQIGGIPDLITHMENGLLAAAKNSQELAKNIERLVTDPSLRKELGLRAKQKMEKEFNLWNMLTKTFSLYKNV